MPDFSGVSHVVLTVTDLERSKAWYEDLFGIQTLFEGEEDGIKYNVNIHPGSNLLIGLRQHAAGSGDQFTPERTGLDHVSFACNDRAELEKWQATFEEKGVTYTPVIDTPYGHVLNFKDPDNIALEMFAMPTG
jgi:catechol 2,3-dioxygenase-like lactoylglutathione lyase family enzyme